MARSRLLTGILSTLAATCAAASAGTLDSLWHVPADYIYNEDRVDCHWAFNAGTDSVQVDFHDGTVVTVAPDQTPYRHVYRDAGRYDLSLTVWEDGAATQHHESNFVFVRQRPIPGSNYMFMHHSTGRNLITDSGVRSLIDLHNARHETDIALWDHDYHSGSAHTGIILPDSTVHLDWSYGEEANDIQPWGYHTIFCQGSTFRDSLLNRHDVIVLKNDHKTGDMVYEGQLIAYQMWYEEIRDVMDQYPDKRFVLVSGPPRRPEDITNNEADRARRFYDWLQSPEYMNGHVNVSFFDLFDLLAYPDDSDDPERNMLRAEYRRPYGATDSHPNEYANLVIGPQFAEMLIRIQDPSWVSVVTDAPAPRPWAALRLHPNRPNPFNPATTIAYELERPGLTSLDIFDLSGRLIRRILEPTLQPPGSYSLHWDGTDAAGRAQPSGVYLYRLSSGRDAASRRMILVR
jgi:hypothetical protein